MLDMDEKMPTARLIQTVPGFGIFLAVLVAVEIEHIGRFEDVGKFHAYAGLIPSTHSSGRGASMARRLLTIIYKLLTERRDYRHYLRTNKRNYRLPSYRM